MPSYNSRQANNSCGETELQSQSATQTSPHLDRKSVAEHHFFPISYYLIYCVFVLVLYFTLVAVDLNPEGELTASWLFSHVLFSSNCIIISHKNGFHCLL